ncbi:MAG: PorV/PorQ family protein [bacterium]|nr:PorV/PorQ family protein [bacterium]
MNPFIRKQAVRTLGALLCAAALLGASAASAQDDGGVAGGYLRYGSSARSLSLGNAVVSIADDAATAYWNPAGLAQLRTMEITGMGATMFEDTRYAFFSLGMPTEQWGTFALSGIFTTSGEFERATWDADLTETFSERENVVSMGWATSWKRFALGATVKAVSQDIGGASGSSMGMDVGLYYRPHRLLSVGGAVQNFVTPKITLLDEEEELARSARAGVALRFFSSRLLLSGDLVKTKWMDTSLRTGLEAWPMRSLALRGGYDTEREHLSAGAGFRLNNWQLDYAFVDTDLGMQHVVSATLRFGVPFGVKMSRDRALFSPSGADREVRFDIETAVRGSIDSWRVVIVDETGRAVRTLDGNGAPPDGVSWQGEDEEGRLVGDGTYQARISIVDSLGEQWEHTTSVDVLGFKDRTRVPIRVEISGNAPASPGGSDR